MNSESLVNFGKIKSDMSMEDSTNDPGHGNNVKNGNLKIEKVLDGQIPLKLILERLVYQSFAELQNLSEVLPGMTDIQRKKALLNHFLHVRKQMTKLLVLVRWSKHSVQMQKCLDIIGFLQSQNSHFDNTVASLAQVRDSLKLARIRNYDIPTAIDVLSTGKFQRLPEKIKDDYVPQDLLSAEEVISILGDIDEAIRTRLMLHELIPPPFKLYTICDGRVIFKIANLFEISLTIGGVSKDEQWFIIDFRFLFEKRGDDCTIETPSRIRDQVIEIGNATLLSVSPEDNSSSDMPPLYKLYNFCLRFALSYKLEVLLLQAQNLARTRWSEQLKVDVNQQKQTFKMTYWAHPMSLKPTSSRTRIQGQAPTAPAFSNVNSIEFSLFESEERDNVDSLIRQTSSLSSSVDKNVYRIERLEIKWTWTKDGTVAENKVPDVYDLDVEKILDYVTRTHANELICHLSALSALQPKQGFLAADDIELVDEQDELSIGNPGLKSLQVHLRGTNYVTVQIDTFNGRLSLISEGGDMNESSITLRAAEERINGNSLSFYEVLQRLKFAFIMDELALKIGQLGYSISRRMAIPREELAKFGSATRYLLYLQIPQESDYYLVFAMTDHEFHYYLVHLSQQGSDAAAISWFVIDMIHELDWIAASLMIVSSLAKQRSQRSPRMKRNRDGTLKSFVAKEGSSDIIIDSDMLERLVTFCRLRVAYRHVELQLSAFFIPYQFLPLDPGMTSLTSAIFRKSSLDLTNGVNAPQFAVNMHKSTIEKLSQVNSYVLPLYISANSLSAGGGDFAREKIFIRISLPSLEVKVEAKLRVNLKNDGNFQTHPGKNSVSNVHLDTRTSIMTFTYSDPKTCVANFIGDWAKIAKVARLVRQTEASNLPSSYNVKIVSFDLYKVIIAYGSNFEFSIGIEYRTGDEALTDESHNNQNLTGYQVSMEGGEDGNPHRSVIKHLEAVLNQQDSLRSLVMELCDTLPLYAQLSKIQMPRLRSSDDDGQQVPFKRTSLIRVDSIPRSLTYVRVIYSLDGPVKNIDLASSISETDKKSASPFALDIQLCAPQVFYVVDASRQTSLNGQRQRKASLNGIKEEIGAGEVEYEMMSDAMLELPKGKRYQPIKSLDMTIQRIMNEFHVPAAKVVPLNTRNGTAVHARQFSSGSTPMSFTKSTMTPPESWSPTPVKSSVTGPGPVSMSQTPILSGKVPAPNDTHRGEANSTQSDVKNRLTMQLEQCMVVQLNRGVVCHRKVIAQVLEMIDAAIKADLTAM